MAKVKTGALEALRKLKQQRSELDLRETELRQKAAAELGQIVLECGAEQLNPGLLKSLLRAAVRLGPDIALERMTVAK
jgi:hypothetical protein